MPLMHSEDLIPTSKCVVEMFAIDVGIQKKVFEPFTIGNAGPYLDIFYKSANDHMETIKKFGRYPYRN